MSSLRPSRTLQNLEVSGLRYARNEVPVNGGLMQVESDGEVVISRNVELDTLTVIGETTFTGDVTVETTLTANTLNTTNLNVSGPSILTGPVTSLAGITASSLYVSNGITAGGSLDIGGAATIHGLLTAAAGITTTNIDTDTMRARDIAVDTLHVVTIDDVNVVSSVSTNVVRGVQIVAGTEDPFYTFLPYHTFDVSGSAFITNNLGIGVTGTTAALDVSGAAIFRDLVTANSGVTASSMNVSGSSTVYGTQLVYDLLSAFAGITSSMINVSGAATVYGDSTVKGLFTASGGITGSSLAISGNTVLYGTETVNGLLTANGGITGSSLDIAGDTTVYGTETVKGLLTAEGGITSSSLIVSNGITGFGTLNITGAATFNSTETVNGLLTANAGITSSSLSVSGNTILYGTETVKGLLTAEGGITSSSLDVAGNTVLYGAETVKGLLTADGGITSSSLNVSNGITGFGTLNITGTATFNSTETVNGLLTANGGITSSALYISNGITGNSTLRIAGTASVGGLLTASGGITSTTIDGSTFTSYDVIFVKTISSQAALRTTIDNNVSYIQPVGSTGSAGELRISNVGNTTPSLSVNTNSTSVGINKQASSAYTLDVNGTSRFNNLITATGGITASSLHVSGTLTFGDESFDAFKANTIVVGSNNNITPGNIADMYGNVNLISASTNNITLSTSGPSGRKFFIAPQVNSPTYSLITQTGDAAMIYSDAVAGGGLCIGPSGLGGVRLDGTGKATFSTDLTVNGTFTANGSVVNLVRSVTGTSNNISATNVGGNVTLNLVNTGVTAGTYPYPESITVDNMGRLSNIIGGTPSYSQNTFVTTPITIYSDASVLNPSPYGKLIATIPVTNMPNVSITSSYGAIHLITTISYNVDIQRPLQFFIQLYNTYLGETISGIGSSIPPVCNTSFKTGIGGSYGTITISDSYRGLSQPTTWTAANTEIKIYSEFLPINGGDGGPLTIYQINYNFHLSRIG